MFTSITSSLCESRQVRDIKATAGWQWQEKAAMRVIAANFAGSRLLAARSIYVALTEIASDQRTPSHCKAACSYIGHRAGISEGTARRYLHELAALGLLVIKANGNRAYNTYWLLAAGEQRSNKLVPAMMLADSEGMSTAAIPPTVGYSNNPLMLAETFGSDYLPPTEGFGDEPLAMAETFSSAPLAVGRGIPGAPQYKNEILKTKNNKQTMVVLADGGIADEDTSEAPTVRAHPTSQLTSTQIPQSDETSAAAIRRLASIGVRLATAATLVEQHGAATVVAWVRYALAHTGSIKRPAGFVLSRLAAGEEPPMRHATAQGHKKCLYALYNQS